MIYIDQIRDVLAEASTYIEENRASCEGHPAGRVSGFWRTHFGDRQNFPDTSEFLSFRRSSFMYGIGDTLPTDKLTKQAEFDAVMRSMLLFTPLPFIERLREPIFGAPQTFRVGTACMSTSFLLNAGTTWRIMSLADQFGLEGPLHVAEIGAGWGACANQLHQSGRVLSYTIIDLPENLCLSSAYLSCSLVDRRRNFVNCANREVVLSPSAGTLNFALPPAIDKLSGPYDLIINTMSFQEMDRESVDAYLGWASRSLRGGGLLISINAHDKAGVTLASQYLHRGLSLVHMGPFRKVPTGWFNTIPYEMVFRRVEETASAVYADAVDVLGELIQLGLDSCLAPLASRVINSFEETCSLRKLHQVFYADNAGDRHRAVSWLASQDDPIYRFVAGNVCYAQGDFRGARGHLEYALSGGLDGFSRLRAKAMLHTIGMPIDMGSLLCDAAGLSRELEILLTDPDIPAIQEHISRIFNCPVEPPSAFARLIGWIRKVGRKGLPTGLGV